MKGANGWLGPACVAAAAAVLGLLGCSSSDEQNGGQGAAAGGAGAVGGAGAQAASGGTGDAGAPSGGAGGSGGSGGVGAVSTDLVALHTHELEVAVNVDTPSGGSQVRWYGGWYPVEQDAVITNVVVSSVRIELEGAERSVTSPILEGSAISELPTFQRTMFGGITATAAELEQCGQSGPAVHRIPVEVVVRMTGSSDQGAWAAEAPLSPPDSLWTCHGGVSAVARGMVDVWHDPPMVWTDINAGIRLNTELPLDSVVVSSVVIHGEGIAATYDAPNLMVTPIPPGPPYGAMSLFAQKDGDIGEELCPSDLGTTPPELYLTYAGTADGEPFVGTAPAGSCMQFPGPD